MLVMAAAVLHVGCVQVTPKQNKASTSLLFQNLSLPLHSLSVLLQRAALLCAESVFAVAEGGGLAVSEG